MKILETEGFKNKVLNQVDYIAQDKPKGARKFQKELKASLKKLIKMPFRNRRSIYFKDENIRDLIFKGYTITYLIKPESIIVFGFKKNQQAP